MFQECHLNLALCLQKQKHFDKAVACLTSLLHYSPGNFRAYYLRGKQFRSLNKYEQALKDFEKALSLAEKNGGLKPEKIASLM
jgi:tetratricopeptide (TPR) repeat protein